MAIEEASSNLGTATAPKPMQELFPVLQVLDMLQRNDRLGEKPLQPRPPALTPAALPKENVDNDNTHEDIASDPPPSQQEDASQESESAEGDASGEFICPKCGNGFVSSFSLRTHLANVYPCDQPRPVVMPREGKMESKTCFKCGKTFASWQGLRGHLNRIKPCDQEKPVSATIRRKPAATRTCTKCGKTFSSPQSLRIHMNRVKPCDEDKLSVSTPTTPPGSSPPSTPLIMNEVELKKEAERKAKARYQARKAYLKKRGRLGELGDPPTAFKSSEKGQTGEGVTGSKPELKRNAPGEPTQENGRRLIPSTDKNKRPRVEETDSREVLSAESPSDVAGLAHSGVPAHGQPVLGKSAQSNSATQAKSLIRKTAQPNASIPVIRKAVSKNGGSFVHRSSKGHGGDLLAGGCSCPPCVRRWARKIMNRMQQLEDEVLVLRQKKTGAVESGYVTDPKSTAAPQSLPLPNISGVSVSYNSGVSRTKPAENFRALATSTSSTTFQQPTSGYYLENGDPVGRSQQQASPATSALSGGISDQKRLMDAYSHMNDQILLNETTVEDSTGHVQILVGIDQGAAMEFRKQIAELRMSISAEKSKRDVTIATLIAHEWKSRVEEFKEVLQRTGEHESPNEEQSLHSKWSEIAKQVSLKDEVISDLEKRMDSLGEAGSNSRSSYAEMGELSSKMAAEYAAKMSLESEREGVYLGLVTSSSRIRALVRKALL
ncbi:unnamed protein product [Phytophthora fragariaefolia]|uniref:Unnamed protein product n=1 Tax=Phytophthora fragariaefolia TaxID=1490495 RepID=A0A9W7CUH7_9STRA|nr:unnamed protein product [Phytophthora fragariaefolia]